MRLPAKLLSAIRSFHTAPRKAAGKEQCRALVLTGLLAVFLSGVPASTPAEAQTSIKVVVNDIPITSYDIDNRTRFLRLTSRGQAGRKQAVDQLIEEALKFQEAKRRNVTVPDAEVDRAFAGIASRAKLSPSKLSAALRQQGVNPITLKNRIRADIAWGRIVRADARGAINVSEQDVIDALGGREEDGSSAARAEIAEYNIQQILFVIPSKASKAYIAQRKREAEGFRGRFTGCDASAELAKGLRDVVVRPIIRRNERQLADSAEQISRTAVGKTTRPEKVEDGYELLAVCSKKSIRGASEESAKVRGELMNERGQQFSRQKLRDLKAGAMIEYR
ncbi:MAG TPA: SurA N-terminal domain-containing protein [Afifellaceae bacterium]|nr:SurA N-terminal domain-containing protein [Afifellaceae bacterium]